MNPGVLGSVIEGIIMHVCSAGMVNECRETVRERMRVNMVVVTDSEPK